MLRTYITVIEHLMHVDALRVEDRLFRAGFCCGFAQQAARQASRFHDDGVLGECCQDWSKVKVHLADRQDQLNLEMGLKDQH